MREVSSDKEKFTQKREGQTLKIYSDLKKLPESGKEPPRPPVATAEPGTLLQSLKRNQSPYI